LSYIIVHSRQGKNQFQLAEAYKQEGNDWIKGLKDEQTDRGKRMIYIEAWKRYTQALSFVSKVDANDSSTVAEEEIPKIQGILSMLPSLSQPQSIRPTIHPIIYSLLIDLLVLPMSIFVNSICYRFIQCKTSSKCIKHYGINHLFMFFILSAHLRTY
jgi:hypothetical protein